MFASIKGALAKKSNNNQSQQQQQQQQTNTQPSRSPQPNHNDTNHRSVTTSSSQSPPKSQLLQRISDLEHQVSSLQLQQRIFLTFMWKRQTDDKRAELIWRARGIDMGLKHIRRARIDLYAN